MTRSLAILASFVVTLGAAPSARAALVHRWKLDETGGTLTFPATGGVKGTLASSALFTNGLSGNAIKLAPTSETDSNSYVEFPGANKPGIGDFTVLFWVNSTFNRLNGLMDLVGTRGTQALGNYYSIRLRGDGAVTAEIAQDAQGAAYVSLNSGRMRVNDGKWHHVALRRNILGVTLFIDGAVADGKKAPPANLTNVWPLRIGRSVNSPMVQSGAAIVDDLNIYNVPLDASDVREVFFETGGSVLLTDQLARMYAPELRFDEHANGFPMSAQAFYDQVIATGAWQSQHPVFENREQSADGMISGALPSYYDVTTCGSSQVRINYWFFYGHQWPCFVEPISGTRAGEHNGDWEHIMVTLTEDGRNIAAVTYYQHEGQYTRLGARNGFEWVDETHPVVRVGRLAHGSFFDEGGNDSVPGLQCMYFNDMRKDAGRMPAWRNLISLDGNEPWMVRDRLGDFTWGYQGINTHPTKKPPKCDAEACYGTDLYDQAGCLASMCRAGDVEFVNNDGDPICIGVNGVGGRDYRIPQGDTGLLWSN